MDFKNLKWTEIDSETKKEIAEFRKYFCRYLLCFAYSIQPSFESDEKSGDKCELIHFIFIFHHGPVGDIDSLAQIFDKFFGGFNYFSMKAFFFYKFQTDDFLFY